MPEGKDGLLTEGRMVDKRIVDRFRSIVNRIRTVQPEVLESDAKHLAGINPWGNLYETKGLNEAQQAEELQRRLAEKQEWVEVFEEIRTTPNDTAALAVVIDKHYDRFAGELREIDSNLEKLGLGPDIATPTDEDKLPD